MKRTRAHKFLIVITLLIVLAAMGCGTNSPVTPSQENTLPGVESPLFAQLITSAGSSRDMLSGSSGSALISAEDGGIVSNGYYSLYFPPGALNEDTEITITMPRYPEAVVELTPHGIHFNKGVILSLPLTDIDSASSSYDVYWYNENTGLWEDIGGYTEDGAAKVELQHFSDYGFIDKG